MVVAVLRKDNLQVTFVAEEPLDRVGHLGHGHENCRRPYDIADMVDSVLPDVIIKF